MQIKKKIRSPKFDFIISTGQRNLFQREYLATARMEKVFSLFLHCLHSSVFSSSSWMALDDLLLSSQLSCGFCSVWQQPQHGKIFGNLFSFWKQPVTLTTTTFPWNAASSWTKKPHGSAILTTPLAVCACLAVVNAHMLQYAHWHFQHNRKH